MRVSVLLFIGILLSFLPEIAIANSWASYLFSSSSNNEVKSDEQQVLNDNDDDDRVSPIVNRELEASVVAHDWPTTPQSVLCEAYAYHQPEADQGKVFLQRLVELLDEKSNDNLDYQTAYDLALEASPLQGSAKQLFAYALSLRSTSPQCELHRGLARQTIQQQQQLPQNTTNLQVMAVVHPLGQVILASDQIPFVEWNSLAQTASNDTVTDDDILLLPGEVPMNDNNRKLLVILYANLGTTAFRQVYQELQKANLRFVVRHLGAVHYEEDSTTASKTILQGYGVRLDIRNVEYKVFDDRHAKYNHTDGNDDALLNLNKKDGTIVAAPPPQFLAGVNVSAIDTIQDELQTKLWKLHEAQQSQAQIIPPLWQRRKLPLQAATVLASARDPLVTLEEISHNLPSVASTLVHVKIPEAYENWSKSLENEKQSLPASGRIYINGRAAVSMDRPAFNVFELLNLLRSEQTALEQMQAKLGPYLDPSALRLVQRAWMMGDEFAKLNENESDDDDEEGSGGDVFRIDVGRGWKQAIMYLNDVEKDAQYEQWTKSVRQMLMNMQFGMPPAVRRNLFTILGVIDPIAEPESAGLNLGFQLMQNSFPARVGVLMVSEDDVKACAEWVSANSPDTDAPCPIKPLSETLPKTGTFEDVKATAQAVHRLFSQFMSDFAVHPGASAAYIEYLLTAITEHKETQGDLSLQDLLVMHGELLEGMQIMSSSEAQSKAKDTLRKQEDKDNEDAYLYGKAVRFAVEKGIHPGMSFLNGRPLPSDPDNQSRSLGAAFQEEQKHVFGLIMKGDITDNSGSVYAKLLKGSRVFKKAHPLLIGGNDKGDSYLQLDHTFGPDSLLQPKSSSSYPDAHFVVEAVLDFGSQDGLELATKFVSVLDAFPSSIESSSGGSVQVGVGYRIMPSTESAAQSPLCPVLAHASLLGVASVQAALTRFSQSDKPSELEKILASIPSLSDDLRQRVIASATDGPCLRSSYLETVNDLPSSNMIIANGRVYAMETNAVGRGDIELLLGIELGRARAVSQMLKEHRSSQNSKDLDAAGRVAAFLAVEEESSPKGRTDVVGEILHLEEELDIKDNPLRFSWNADRSQETDSPLKVEICVLVDPVADSTQRLAPLLRVFRDELKLPLELILSPASLIDSGSKVPITSYYRFVAQPRALPDIAPPKAHFSYLPTNHVLTLRMDVPEPWDVQQTKAIQDSDNLLCDIRSGCGDEAVVGGVDLDSIPIQDRRHLTEVEYGLNHLLVFGQCYESSGSPPNGLQLSLSRNADLGLPTSSVQDVGVQMDGSIDTGVSVFADTPSRYSDTLVMKNVGYWQLRANPGVWMLKIADESKGAEIFDFIDGSVGSGRIVVNKDSAKSPKKTLVMKDFVNRGELLLVKRRPGFEKASLFFDKPTKATKSEDEVINVFSLATGHLYERFMKIMMLSVTKRTSSKVKFWLFENFLSPTFKASAIAMAERIGCEVEFCTYKWPEWLRSQTEKQRIIWGYKILFLDVLFPLDVKKIIYVDADQVVRGDLKELWDMDLKGAPYGYTPFCTSRESTLGYQFWRDGFWKNHLQGKPYHISALYVVDLETFRRNLVGDQLRAIYQQLSADPNSLSNLDQDLPNYAQHQVPIFSLPQEWLWCESWCSDETKASAKTIDLCNNPMHKEPKVSMAKRVISGPLFNESWVELDAEVERYYQEYLKSTGVSK